ncbi:MAG TPA: hypothetical protein VGE67_05055, partial [Haloferula sp.]
MRTTRRVAYVAGLALVVALTLVLRHREAPRIESKDETLAEDHRVQSDVSQKTLPPAPDRKAIPRESLTVDELVAIFEKDGAEAALAAAKGL